MYKIATLLIVFLLVSTETSAQEINQNRKKINATRVTTPPRIDGIIDEDAWANAPTAKNFVMMRPTNGEAEKDTHKTTVKLVYDDNAVYISAVMNDPEPSKIPKEFVNRDNIGNADFFMMLINPNDDGQNATAFAVTASGVQVDFKVSNGGREDWNWNAVWSSAHTITDTGWAVEMKIPYRALRFANEDVQSWGMNFHREIRNLNARYTWNHIDNQQGNWTQYDGLVENFENIKPPTRLSFYPYASDTVTEFDGQTDFDWSVGMDVKYGLTENFTLDATLIPDFGQVGFDNVTLNLGPFEQQFSEQRQFFTEGTELFGKGNLFYSRRIGGAPIDEFANERRNDDDFVNGEKVVDEVIDSPNKVQMLNAIKVSGRTKDGLGIGVFNAVTEKTEATVKRTTQTINPTTNEITETVEEYKTTTNPLSNYNILVLDQQFNQNSSVSLINTNVLREGRFRDANATGLLWHLENKKSTYNIDGNFRMTNVYENISTGDANNTVNKQTTTGYSFDTSFGKHAGKWRWEIGYQFSNKDFNPNDLGIQFRNNTQRIYGFTGYRLLNPKGIFNNYGINWYYNANFLHHNNTFTRANTGLSFWANTKNRFSFGANLNFSSKSKDFFEPRQGTLSGVHFERPMRLNINHWASTDFRKKFAIDYDFWHTFFKQAVTGVDQRNYGFGIRPRYRFNNQFSLIYGFNYQQSDNEYGFVNQEDDTIYFGQRDWTSYNNSLTGKYSFNTNSSLSLTFRHNWSKVPYKNFYTLNQNNGALENSNYIGDHNMNFNSWNLDLNYLWQFAPGSQLIAFYRNSISSFDNNTNPGFFKNLDNLLNQPNQHTFSVRLVYFIDYNNIKNIF